VGLAQADACSQPHYFSARAAYKGDLMIEGLFQPMHLLLVAGIALLIFGPKKLPELGKGLGEGIRGFKASMSGESDAEAEKATIEKDKVS
jgi:sec-independent protein translocase protein TatA